jgi:hypothetical protein
MSTLDRYRTLLNAELAERGYSDTFKHRSRIVRDALDKQWDELSPRMQEIQEIICGGGR